MISSQPLPCRTQDPISSSLPARLAVSVGAVQRPPPAYSLSSLSGSFLFLLLSLCHPPPFFFCLLFQIALPQSQPGMRPGAGSAGCAVSNSVCRINHVNLSAGLCGLGAGFHLAAGQLPFHQGSLVLIGISLQVPFSVTYGGTSPFRDLSIGILQRDDYSSHCFPYKLVSGFNGCSC